MNDYLVMGLTTVVLAAVLYIAVRWRVGKGLMSSLFGVVLPSMAAVAYAAFLVGKMGAGAFSLTIAAAAGSACVLLMLVVIQRTVINRIREPAKEVLAVVNNLSLTSAEAAASAEEQAAAAAQVTSSIEEIHRMSQSTTTTAQEVVKTAALAVAQGHEGLESVREVASIMDRFAAATDFVQVVGEVAEQSNLLAVNAGIEASKAGDYGRGFAVVASEVRTLAEQSKAAAKQIREAINQTKNGRDSLRTTDLVITNLGTVLQEASDKARQISGAAVQQSAGIKQISDAMGNLTQGGSDTAAASMQIKRAAEELQRISRKLTFLIQADAQRENPL